MDLRLGAAPLDASWKPGRDEHHLCFSWQRYASLRERGLGAAATAWDDHFPEMPEAVVLEETERLAEGWRFVDGKDYTVFRGVSLGRCWRWLLWKQVMPSYRFVLSMQAALARFRPKSVVCEAGVPDVYHELLRDMSRGAAWTLRFDEGGAWTEPSSTVATAPPRVRQSLLKRAAAGALNLAGRLAGGRERPPLLLSYYPPFAGAAKLMARGGYPLRVLCVDAPPRPLLARLIMAGGGLLTEPRAEPAFEPVEREELEAVRASWARERSRPGLFDCRGVSLAPALEPAVSAFMGEPAEQLAWAVLRGRDLWARERPGAALLPYEEPPYQMMLAELARQNGTPCAHFVHGLPDRHRVPFVRNSSSHLIFWGPEQRKGYERNGCLEGRTALTIGNPGFDALAASRPPVPNRVRRVLALTAPASPAVWTESDLGPQRYVEGLLSAFSAFPDLRLSLKLHPSERLEYYRDLSPVRDSGVTLLRDGSFAEHARAADLVVGPFSTALMEAMILNRPVLVLRWTRTPYDAPFDGRWCVEPLESPEALAEKLKHLRDQPQAAIAEILAGYPRLLDAFAGPLDGRSSQRLAAALAGLAAQREPA